MVDSDSETPTRPDPATATREARLRAAIEDFFYGFRAFTALPDRVLAERGLGRTHHRILYFARSHPGIAMGELLTVLGISKQAAHQPVKELQRQGLVESVRDEQDGRVRRLRATAAGRELEAALSAAQMALLDEAFIAAGPDAERHWRQVMTLLRDRLTSPVE